MYTVKHKEEPMHEVVPSSVQALDILNVLHDNRILSRLTVSDRRLSSLQRFCRENNLALEVSPYKIQQHDYGFDLTANRFGGDSLLQGFHHAYVSKSHDLAKEAKAAEFTGDHLALADMMELPTCCQEALYERLSEDRNRKHDHVFDAAARTRRSGKWQTNATLYPFGKGLISHVPCTFRCRESSMMGKESFKLLSECSAPSAKRLKQWMTAPVVVSDSIHLLKGAAPLTNRIKYQEVVSAEKNYLHHLLASKKEIHLTKKMAGEVPLPSHHVVRWS